MGNHKILISSSTFPRWKNDTTPPFVFYLAKELSKYYRVDIIAPHSKNSPDHELMDGINVYRFRYAPEKLESLAYEGGVACKIKQKPWRLILVPFFLLSQFLAMRALVKSNNYDLINAHWLIPQGLVAVSIAARKRIPVLITSHGSDLYTLDNFPLNFLKKIILRHARAITVVSNAMIQKVKSLVSDADISVIPMGTDLKGVFVPDDYDRRIGNVLYVGRLVSQKGVDVLIKAMARVREYNPEASLTIIGEGPDGKQLENLASHYGLDSMVEFIGPVRQDLLAKFYQRANITVQPTKSGKEGFGLVTVEAMGCGCPVIATELVAVSDVCRHRLTALVIQADDVEALTQAIISLIRDKSLAKRLSENALNYVREQYGWDKTALEYRNLINSIIIDKS